MVDKTLSGALIPYQPNPYLPQVEQEQENRVEELVPVSLALGEFPVVDPVLQRLAHQQLNLQSHALVLYRPPPSTSTPKGSGSLRPPPMPDDLDIMTLDLGRLDKALASLAPGLAQTAENIKLGLANAELKPLPKKIMSIARAVARHELSRDKLDQGIPTHLEPGYAEQLLDCSRKQVRSICRQLQDSPKRLSHYRENAAKSLDALADVLLERISSARPIDPRAALAHTVETGKLLSLGESITYCYGQFGAVDAFTNENNLSAMLTKVPVRGGAVIGVSGAMLDIASRVESDVCLVVDAHPNIQPAMQIISGILLLADMKCDGDDAARATLVCQALDGEFDPALAFQLAEIGVPSKALWGASNVLKDVEKGFSLAPDNCWAKSKDKAQRIAHLTKLASRGRLIGITADLADPQLSKRIDVFLKAHRSKASVVNLSNALDYIPNALGCLQGVAQWDFAEGAQITGCSKYSDLQGLMGTLDDPKSHHADKLLREGAGIHEALWADKGYRQTCVSGTVVAILGGRPDKVSPALKEVYDKFAMDLAGAKTHAEFVDHSRRLEEAVLAEPKLLEHRLISLMEDRQRLVTYQIGAVRTDGIRFDPPPTSIAKLISLSDDFDRSVWSDGKAAVRVVENGANWLRRGYEQDPRVDYDSMVDTIREPLAKLSQAAKQCKTCDDVQEICATVFALFQSAYERSLRKT